MGVVGPGPSPGRSIPAHMRIDRERLHPGSGCLAVRTIMEGPIRVLQITDVSQGVSMPRYLTNHICITRGECAEIWHNSQMYCKG